MEQTVRKVSKLVAHFVNVFTAAKHLGSLGHHFTAKLWVGDVDELAGEDLQVEHVAILLFE